MRVTFSAVAVDAWTSGPAIRLFGYWGGPPRHVGGEDERNQHDCRRNNSAMSRFFDPLSNDDQRNACEEEIKNEGRNVHD